MFVVGLQRQSSIWVQNMKPLQECKLITSLLNALHGDVIELAQLF